jgi:hypothetical protein
MALLVALLLRVLLELLAITLLLLLLNWTVLLPALLLDRLLVEEGALELRLVELFELPEVVVDDAELDAVLERLLDTTLEALLEEATDDELATDELDEASELDEDDDELRLELELLKLEELLTLLLLDPQISGQAKASAQKAVQLMLQFAA